MPATADDPVQCGSSGEPDRLPRLEAAPARWRRVEPAANRAAVRAVRALLPTDGPIQHRVELLLSATPGSDW